MEEMGGNRRPSSIIERLRSTLALCHRRLPHRGRRNQSTKGIT